MIDLGTFKKHRQELPPAGVIAWFLIIGYLLVALCAGVAVVRITETAKIQAQEDRI